MPYADPVVRREYMRAYKIRKRELYQDYDSRRHLFHTYGLTLEKKQQISDSQGGACAICKEKKRLVVDHCHKTGYVRGLLCNGCNHAAGALKEDPAIIANLLAYLSNSRSANGRFGRKRSKDRGRKDWARNRPFVETDPLVLHGLA